MEYESAVLFEQYADLMEFEMIEDQLLKACQECLEDRLGMCRQLPQPFYLVQAPQAAIEPRTTCLVAALVHFGWKVIYQDLLVLEQGHTSQKQGKLY